MKTDPKQTNPVDNNDTGNEEELTEQEKLMYQMIWGKKWDDAFPPKGSKTKGK